MSMSAFKSSATRRVNNLTHSSKASSNKESKDNAPKKEPPLRRSKSVSAFARTKPDVSTDFLIKRDNPLFWGTNSTLDNETRQSNAIDISKFNDVTSRTPATNGNVSRTDDRRGRSVSRNAEFGKNVSGNRKETGQSLSRVDTGRRFRSVSRPPVSSRDSVNSEDEVEQESSLSWKYRNKKNMSTTTTSTNVRKSNLFRSSSNSDVLDRMKGLPTDSSASALSCRQNPVWEDGLSVSSLSESEENTIKAVSEQMPVLVDNLGGDASASAIYETVRSEVRRAISDIQSDLENAIRRSNATVIAAKNITDIPPDLVSPSAVEILLDIKSEYAKKLEQSHERARKLRADLAVEEHRELELSRILKEVLADPKNPSMQKSRPGRKSSIERRKMSKRLNEEAMAYFDECVSLSTFDSSDFSSQEDPPHNTAGITTSVGDNISIPHASPSITAAYCPSSCLSANQEFQITYNRDASELTANSSSKVPTKDPVGVNSNGAGSGKKYQFSFSRKATEAFELQQDIRKYVKNFEKDREELDVDSQLVRSNHIDLDEYNSKAASPQSLLFDRVFFKNRLESGSLLLCGGGTAISFSPFASVI